MPKESSDSLDTAKFLGAEALTSLRHPAVETHLGKILERMPSPEIPDFESPISHETYVGTRELLAQSTMLAALAGDSRLDSFIGQWVALQHGYAGQVIVGANAGVIEQEELRDAHDDELRAGEKDREAYDELKRKSVDDLNDDEFKKLGELRTKVRNLDETEKTREELHRSITGVAMVETTLTALVESGRNAIHYIVPSVTEAQHRLGNGTYDGPIFEPFLVSTRQAVQDIYARGVLVQPIERPTSTREIDLGRLAPLLAELCVVYDHIEGESIGQHIVPSVVIQREDLEMLSSKGLSSFMDRNQQEFGVQLVEGSSPREFRRLPTGSTLGKHAFVWHIVGDLQNPTDRQHVNEHYFEQAIALLRERQEAYGGFTNRTVVTLAEDHNLPVTGHYIARNLGKFKDVETRSGAGTPLAPYIFAFQTVLPTSAHRRRAETAVGLFGVNRFSPNDLVSRIEEDAQGKIHPRVVDTMLEEHHAEWGLRIASDEPLQYQKADRSVETPTAPKRITESLM